MIMFNPILTGLFETKFLLLGGGGVNLTPPSDLGPEGADRREILHGCEDTSNEYCYNFFVQKTVYLLYYYNLCKLDACFHKFINISNK